MSPAITKGAKHAQARSSTPVGVGRRRGGRVLQAEAKAKREAADAEPVAPAGKADPAKGGAVDPAEAAKASTPVAVTSSAAGLIALGQSQGGGVQQQTLAEIKQMRKDAHESRKDLAKLAATSEKTKRLLENLGLGAT